MKYNIWQVKDINWLQLGRDGGKPYKKLSEKINRNKDMFVSPGGELCVICYHDDGSLDDILIQNSELFELEILK